VNFAEFPLKFFDVFNPLLTALGDTFSQAITLTPDSIKKKYQNFKSLDRSRKSNAGKRLEQRQRLRRAGMLNTELEG